MSDLLQELKQAEEFEYLVSLGDDRHLFRVPTSTVEEHEDFQRLRGQAVEKIDLLQASMRRTGGTSWFPPVQASRSRRRLVACVSPATGPIDRTFAPVAPTCR